MPYGDWKSLVPPSCSILNFGTLGGGVLFPPHSLYQDTTNSKLFLELCPKADDIWLWAMAALNDTETCVVNNNITKIISTNYLREKGLINQYRLYTFNRDGGNDTQLHALLDHYPELLQKLQQAAQKELQS